MADKDIRRNCFRDFLDALAGKQNSQHCRESRAHKKCATIGLLDNARCRDNITCIWMSKSFDSTYISVGNYQQSIAIFMENRAI